MGTYDGATHALNADWGIADGSFRFRVDNFAQRHGLIEVQRATFFSIVSRTKARSNTAPSQQQNRDIWFKFADVLNKGEAIAFLNLEIHDD